MPESAGRRFGAELQAWRKLLGVTQVEFAKIIGFSQSYVASVETARRVPSPAFAEACDAATGAPGTFGRWQPQVVSGSFPAFFAPIVEYERAASQIYGWDLGVIPGLLQTEAYARAVLNAGPAVAGEEMVERKVAARLERQEILTKTAPPLVWYVIHESVLHHVIGSQQLMSDQLDHLLDRMAQPNIVIQILPYTASNHPGVDGPVVLYDFSHQPSVGYTEGWGGGRIVQDQQEIGELRTVLSMLHAASLDPHNSITFIEETRRSEFA